MDEMLEEHEREREATSDGKAPRGGPAPQAARIGPISAQVLAEEVFHRDFANRRQVAAYLGLDPSPWQSGQRDLEKCISKSGNRAPARCHRARLVLAAAPARQRTEPLVQGAGRYRQGSRAPADGGGTGAQADRRPVALSGQRHVQEGASMRRERRDRGAAATLPDAPGWTRDRCPFGLIQREKDGSVHLGR